MEDGDGMQVSVSEEADNTPGQPFIETEEADSSKTDFNKDSSGFSSSTPSQSIKMILSYNNVNGDCVEKDVPPSEKSLLASSSTNSFFSESSDVTRDSIPEYNRVENDSSSDSSKSRASDFSVAQLNYSKLSDHSSPFHPSASAASESSSDSDEISDSDDEVKTDPKRVRMSQTQLSESLQNDGPIMFPPGLMDKKVNESSEYSQSDESSRKEQNFNEPVEKECHFNDSDESSTDSVRMPVASSSGGLSQRINNPPDSSNVESDSCNALEDESNENTALSVPDDSSLSSFGITGDTESNSAHSKNSSFKECKSTVSEPQQTYNKEGENYFDGKVTKTKDALPLARSSGDQNFLSAEVINLGGPQDNNDSHFSFKLPGNKVPPVSSDQIDQPGKIDDFSEPNKSYLSSFKSGSDSCFPLIENVTQKCSDINATHDRIADEAQKIATNFSIKYKGFKKIGKAPQNTKKHFLHWNPFNPARKKDPKTGKYVLCQNVDDNDCNSLQPEYAQYLGLQPTIKFKCSYCGMSSFQSMGALNTHKIECKKMVNPQPLALGANKAITIRRKVYMCSICGSYEPRSEVFQHVMEVHNQYVCLFAKCLKVCQSPEALMHHLEEDHKIRPKYSRTQEEFRKIIPNNPFLVCVYCRKVFTEEDDPGNHRCSPKPVSKIDHTSQAQDVERLYAPLSGTPLTSQSQPGPSQIYDINKMAEALKLNKDIVMNALRESQRSESNQYASPPEFRNISTDNGASKMDTDSGLPQITTKPPAEDMRIKVPSDIEIKPLIPGENHTHENKFEPSTSSSIEIFPIPQSQPEKPKRKVRTVIRKTIRKKKIIVGKKRKVIENSLLSNEILGVSESNIAPPVSPPIIAPPPIVRSPVPAATELMSAENNYSDENPNFKHHEVAREEAEENAENKSEGEKSDSPNQPEFSSLPVTRIEQNDIPEIKRSLSQEIIKIKLQSDMDSDGESDDSHKLSLVVDENTNNSEDFKKEDGPGEQQPEGIIDNFPPAVFKSSPNEIPLASEDVAAMALTLDDKIENVPIQAVVKECVRTSCMSCNYCRHAVKIAVNGKQLALHLLSEHRYTPVKNETNEDVIRKLRSSLDILQDMYFNTETYDSSDPSIHVPYDKESNFDCFQCSYVSASHKDLYTHKRKLHTKSLLLCIMCKKNFFSYSELICHICTGTYCADPQVYSVGINFRCCFCHLDTIPSAFRLMVHLRKSHHTCDICLEMCSDQQKLSTHMWKHKLNHLCYRCGIAYASKPDITKHLFWKHGTESVLCKKCLQKKWPHVYHFCIPPTSFNCEECNTSFSKAVALKVHKRIHGNDYPYSCPQCEKKFVSKKLLSRHIDRHNAVFQKKDASNKSPDSKDEIINVTDVDNKDVFQNDNSDSNKGDARDKSHKKHKKEKDKKDKKVVDVYDLPPLNLSSESDSSEEDVPKNSLLKGAVDNGSLKDSDSGKSISFLSEKSKAPDMPKLDSMLDGDDRSMESHNFLSLLKQDENSDEFSKRKLSTSDQMSSFDNSVVSGLLSIGRDDMKNDSLESMQNDHIEGIWENFYKTNPQNSNLPFPLCAMKSEVAYSIIMGDHDYCQISKVEPIIKEDLPSTSNLETHLSDDKLEEISLLVPDKLQTPPLADKAIENTSTPPKKKLKSPKKKMSKLHDDKNSSSSSDSSSDSDSSCSCATNCSCSSSSDSSSSSSSDSDSSTNEDKKDKRKKKKDKKLPTKPEGEIDVVKEEPQSEVKEVEVVKVLEPEDPPIRESELETDESTSDEEFYDRQPQIIANQLLAEKREKQISLGTPTNNGNASPLPTPSPLPFVQQSPIPTPPSTPSQLLLSLPPAPLAQENIPPAEKIAVTPNTKQPRAKRKRRVTAPKSRKAEKPLAEPGFVKYLNEPKPSPFSLYQQSPASRQKLTTPILGRSPSLPETAGSGSETDNQRLSKRRRVPNKFYGYSSGEEEEKQPPKWKKVDTPLSSHHTPKLPPTITHPPPHTPRIQLTVPKQAIRKPSYQKQSLKQKIQHLRPLSSDSSDSGSDIEDRLPLAPPPQEQPKAEKDVYCYCRCPYDEVSEMIACDDANCKIEWFHFECVNILVPPRGQWFCPDCRKARGLLT